MHKLLLPIRGRVLDICLREYATDEIHKQSRGALALGHNLILDETRRNISRSPSEYRGEQASGGGDLVLEGLETFLTFVCPVKLDAFVKQISQRPGNLGEVLNETAAIASESEKTSDLLDGLGRSPVKNSLDTFWGDGNAILGNHMTKVGYFRKPELTLRILSIEFVFSKLLQYKTKMFSMFFVVLGIYQDIIQINHDKLLEIFHEYVVHQSGEGGWSIGQAKGHDSVLV